MAFTYPFIGLAPVYNVHSTKIVVWDAGPSALSRVELRHKNGEYIPHEGPVIQSPDGKTSLPLAPGLGSGNVTTGAFANMIVNLGPVGGLNNTAPGPDNGLGYNPRPLKRDVGPALNERYANYSTVLSTSVPANPHFHNADDWKTFSSNLTSKLIDCYWRVCLIRSKSDRMAEYTT